VDDPTKAAWIIMYSSIGLSYLLYGFKRQKRIAMGAGFGFCLIPHIFTGTGILLLLGLGLFLAPLIWRDL